MAKPLLLDGLVGSTPEQSEGMLHEWRREKQRLEEDILSLRHELDQARSHNEVLERSLRALRQQLSPLHRALRAMFGEIELAVGEETFSAPASASGAALQAANGDPRWEHAKRQFPGKPAEIIDALLVQPPMTIVQLHKFCRMSYDTAKQAVRKLAGAGLIIREGNLVRLAQ